MVDRCLICGKPDIEDTCDVNFPSDRDDLIDCDFKKIRDDVFEERIGPKTLDYLTSLEGSLVKLRKAKLLEVINDQA